MLLLHRTAASFGRCSLQVQSVARPFAHNLATIPSASLQPMMRRMSTNFGQLTTRFCSTKQFATRFSTTRQLMTRFCTTKATSDTASGIPRKIFHFGVALGAFYAADTVLKEATSAAGIKFPAPLIGMFGILGGLWGLAATGRLWAAETVVAAAGPALRWVTRYLPLFYVPALIVLPLSVRNLDASDLGKMGAILALGLPFTMFTAGAIVLAIRRLAAVQLMEVAAAASMAPFTRLHGQCCAAIAAVSAAGLALAGSDNTASWATQQLFLLSCTVGGLLFGSMPPALMAAYMPHPVVATTVFAHLGVAVAGAITGKGYWDTLCSYLTKGKDGGNKGAGDLLMGFLGVVVLTFGFHIFGQRALLQRHAMEIMGCAVGASLVSLIATAAAGRSLGLPPELSLAISPRSVTVALAMPIASQLGVSEDMIPVCAASVLCTGLLGAMTCQRLLTMYGFTDPLVRGLATASSCHGFGTAALAATEPQALPFCALGYGLTGICASCWAGVPPVQNLLRSTAGCTS